METLYTVLGLASSSSSGEQSTSGGGGQQQTNAIVRQAAASTLIRFASHTGLYCAVNEDKDEEEVEEDEDENKEKDEGSGRNRSSGVTVEKSEDAVARMLGDNLDYVVDNVCEDLRKQATAPSSASSSCASYAAQSVGGATAPVVVVVPTTPAVGVLETILRYSDASAAQPLLRDVLASVTIEVRKTLCQ